MSGKVLPMRLGDGLSLLKARTCLKLKAESLGKLQRKAEATWWG